MTLNPLALLRGLTKRTEQPVAATKMQKPIGCDPLPAAWVPAFAGEPGAQVFRMEAYGASPGRQLPGGNGQTVSTGTALAKLDQLKKANPQAAQAIATFAAAVQRLSVNQQFNPNQIAALTPKEAADMETVLALSTALPATNSSRQPIKNLALYTDEGSELFVHTHEGLPAVGDQVTTNGATAPDGVYTVSHDGRKLTVKGGRIAKIEVSQSPPETLAQAIKQMKDDPRRENEVINSIVARNLEARRAASIQSK